MPDFTQGFPRTAVLRLEKEYVVWLTTVDTGGVPQPRPVWFYFEGLTVLLFSQPEAAKVKHIRNHPAVSVHINSNFRADLVTVFIGQARILDGLPGEERLDAYIDKYRNGIQDLGYTPESFLAEYSVPIEVALRQVRGF